MNAVPRKMLALLLCAALCAGLFPAAFAEGGFTFPDGTVIEDTIAFPEPDVEDLMASFPVSEEPELSAGEELHFEVPDDSFIIPRNMTKIEEEAFAGVTGMKRVMIPAGVTEIGEGAFDGCVNLEQVYFFGTGSQWTAINIGARNDALRSATLMLSSGEEWIPITAARFPSGYFRGYVSANIDTDKNGYLSIAERNAVTQINCSGTKDAPVDLQTLKGVEYFYNLTSLYCVYDKLTALDVSGNTKLELLYCANNSLTSLDLSKNTKLSWLSVSNNELSTLDLSKNTGILTLYAHYNKLTSLNVSSNTELANLYTAYNLLTALDLRRNTKLMNVELLGNSLTSLDLSANTRLLKFFCGKNALTSLDVRNNTLLEILDCRANNLTGLDVSRNTALTDLNAAENRLRTLDVSACTALERLQCYTNELRTLTLGANSKLDRLNCAGNSLSELNIKQCPLLMSVYNGTTPTLKDGMIGYFVNSDSPYLVLDQATRLVTSTLSGIPVTSVNFPDSTFRSYISQNCDTNRDGYLSTNEIYAVTSLNLSGMSITTLKGIEYFSSLTVLNCSNNRLTALDVSACTSLELLKCENNLLTTLTLGSNSRLDRLNCSYNDLSQLDIRQCPELVTVCSSLTPYTQSSVTYYHRGDPYPYLILDQATSLIGGGTPTPTGSVPINSVYFPDATFRQGVYDFYDKNGDHYLSASEAAAVDNMYMENMRITSLKGIEYFTNLEVLRCANNPLSSLDISRLPNLRILEIYNTNIRSINVHYNTYLARIVQPQYRYSPSIHGAAMYYLSNNCYFEFVEGTNILT